MKIKIRQAAKKDLPQMVSLYNQPDMISDKAVSLKDAEKIFLKAGKYPFYKVYVAVSGREVVGTYCILIMDTISDNSKAGILEDFVVKKSWQRKGIGAKMVKFAIAVCRKKGCYKLALSSNLKRKGAHRFYNSLKFRKHGYSFAAKIG